MKITWKVGTAKGYTDAATPDELGRAIEGTVRARLARSTLTAAVPKGFAPPSLRRLVPRPLREGGKKSMKTHGMILITASLTVLSGCAGQSDSDSQVQRKESVDQSGVRATLHAQSPSISPGDADAIAEFIDLPRRWNQSAAPLVRDYLDPNVPADRWVKGASAFIGELRAAYLEMQTTTLAIQDPGIRNTFQDITVNYRAKLDCVTALHNAVAQGNQEAEQQAQLALSEASAEGQKLAQGLLDRLRPYVDPTVLADEMRKRGREIGELMKPR